jgi:hypothetical protein
MFKRKICLLMILAFLVGGCSTRQPVDDVNPLILPSVPGPVIQEETPTPTTVLASPTPTCIDDLRFLEDVSIPDGTIVDPGAELDKRWQVQNSSSCNWDSGYSLRLITGSALGANSPQPLYPAVAGSEVTIRILYTAPRDSGIYRSAWQAHNPLGIPFGDPIYIEIVVP